MKGRQTRKYACATGRHNGHRSAKAAAHCFYEADNAAIAVSADTRQLLRELRKDGTDATK